MHKNLLLSLLLCSSAAMYAEKKPLDHTVYDDWKSISENTISDNATYAMYLVKPQEGDTRLVITHLQTGRRIEVERGHSGILSKDNQYAFCLIKPFYQDIRQAKIKKKKADDMPKDSLAIIHLATGKIEKIADVTAYKTGTDAMPLLAFMTKAEPAVASNDSTAQAKKKGKSKKESILLVRNMRTQQTDTLPKATQFTVSYDGAALAAIAKGDSITKNEVFTYTINKPAFRQVATGAAYFGQLAFGKADNRLAFLASADTSAIYSKRCDLYLWENNTPAAICLVDSAAAGIPANWGVSEHTAPSFSKDGKRVYFGTAPIRQLKDTTLVDFETARLDLWHYAEPLIPPMQLKRKARELRRTYLAVTETAPTGKVVQLADEQMKSVLTADEGNARFAVGEDSSPYDIQVQWLGSSTPVDAYAVNTFSGERKLIGKEITGTPLISPLGKFAFWFDTAKGNYFVYDMETAETRCLTEGMGVNFFDEENDMPTDAREYGFAGWLADDKGLLVYDYYDLWQLDPKGIRKPINLTKGEGRKNNTVLRMVRLDREKKFIDPNERLLMQALNKTTKQRGFYEVNLGKNKVSKLLIDNFSFGKVAKAKKKDVFIFQKGNFNTSNNLYITTDRWKSDKRLSDINPQMADYLWGTPELYQWTTFSGKPAEGVVYKPENFDPAKKYPVLIYFYERVSDDFYNYIAPAPSRSIINIPFYTSRGYVVFTPDIRYTDGEPGESAYDYIVSGAQELAKNPWVNSKKMGIQGQSWGGYQVSYLITRTDMFAAAGAGAPVSNMTSAYGGIRWSTGMSRQFQYERTQSRIGKTLWDGFDLYVKNSPVFFADKVNTPVLIMHNDNDGAVPWYQGIEFFMGLRRLNKKAWMLQYNNEEHNLNERRNMNDLVRRWQQFFDHYLKEEPMPAWMKSGIPATRKGMYFGFEAEQP
ncbi:MAG: prolyl oligopeptidase family serine peptidase [Bacteroidales bacterium]